MKTVLIVEDDPINARVFSKILIKRGGLEVKHTEDVEEVMQIAQGREADIILMDVSLSRSIYQGKSVDGIKITQMLKNDPQTADLPIILVTAHAMQGDRRRSERTDRGDRREWYKSTLHQHFATIRWQEEEMIALVSKPRAVPMAEIPNWAGFVATAKPHPARNFFALLSLGMNGELDELKLRSSLYCYAAPPIFSLGSTGAAATF